MWLLWSRARALALGSDQFERCEALGNTQKATNHCWDSYEMWEAESPRRLTHNRHLGPKYWLIYCFAWMHQCQWEGHIWKLCHHSLGSSYSVTYQPSWLDLPSSKLCIRVFNLLKWLFYFSFGKDFLNSSFEGWYQASFASLVSFSIYYVLEPDREL